VFQDHPLTIATRLGRLAYSWVLVAIGVGLLLRSDLGVAPFDVLNTGAHERFGLSFGVWYVIDSLIFFAVGMILGWRPGPATFVGTFVIGPMINLALDLLPRHEALLPRFGYLVAGVLIIGFSVSVVITVDLGVGPTEAVMLGLMRHHWGVIPARIVSDGIPLAVGVALGGAVGIGTVVFLLAMGPMVRFWLARFHYVPPHERAAALINAAPPYR
jgi:uncharacterized membrane protein YczE